MKTLKIHCLVFNLFCLILLQLTLPEVIPAELSSSPMVFIRKDRHVAPLAPLYKGPYKVLARSLKTFQLQVGKRVEVVSVQRLKPAFTADDEAPEEPPRRGRPPRQPPLVPSDPPRRRGRRFYTKGFNIKRVYIASLRLHSLPSASDFILRPLRWGGGNGEDDAWPR